VKRPAAITRARSLAMTTAAAAASVSGCGAAPSAAPAPAAARDDAPAWRVRGPGGVQPIEPGLPASADALLDARGCARCHAAIVDEWSRSRHALAWTNAIFRTEYTVRPQPWCANCHAPLATQQADLRGPRAAQGVDCAACHVRAGKLVARTRRGGSPHETIGDPTFGSPAFCADCHEFTFPVLSREGAALRMTAHPMQATVASFQAGPYARERDGCLSCHGSRHGHAFAGAYDSAMLESALEVAWCREPRADAAGPAGAAPALRVTMRNAAAGHAVPTGDVHRHVDLRLWRSSAPEALYEASFGRRFEPAADGGKTTTSDSTLPPGASQTVRVELARLGGEPDEPVSLELAFAYVGDEYPLARLPADVPTEASVVWRRAAVGELPACDR
jgi:hypothetical protein